MDSNKIQINNVLINKSITKMFFPLGFSLIFIGLLTAIILLIVSSIISENYQQYDYNLIQRKGIIKNAKIVDIVTINNVTVNGISPKVITYKYLSDTRTIMDSFQTLEISKIEYMQRQDSIPICVYNGQSVIKEILPYKISLKLFWILPVILSTIGLLLLFTRQLLKSN